MEKDPAGPVRVLLRRLAILTKHPIETSLYFFEWNELLDPCPLLSLPLQAMGAGEEEERGEAKPVPCTPNRSWWLEARARLGVEWTVAGVAGGRAG